MYLTVMNKITGNSVPFYIAPSGEIVIVSADPINNDEVCEVRLTERFYENSKDYGHYYEKVGVNG